MKNLSKIYICYFIYIAYVMKATNTPEKLIAFGKDSKVNHLTKKILTQHKHDNKGKRANDDQGIKR